MQAMVELSKARDKTRQPNKQKFTLQNQTSKTSFQKGYMMVYIHLKHKNPNYRRPRIESPHTGGAPAVLDINSWVVSNTKSPKHTIVKG